MNGGNEPLPPDVLEALRDGRKVEAIQRLREERGLGLEEAKDAVEDYVFRESRPAGGHEALEADVVEAIRLGHKVDAVKRLRAHRGIGLKDAAELVASYAERNPLPPAPIEPQGGRGLALSLLVFVSFVLGWLAYFFLD